MRFTAHCVVSSVLSIPPTPQLPARSPATTLVDYLKEADEAAALDTELSDEDLLSRTRAYECYYGLDEDQIHGLEQEDDDEHDEYSLDPIRDEDECRLRDICDEMEFRHDEDPAVHDWDEDDGEEEEEEFDIY